MYELQTVRANNLYQAELLSGQLSVLYAYCMSHTVQQQVTQTDCALLSI